MNDPDITQALINSGPAGVALAFLGVVIRSWIQRLESTVDKLAERFDELRESVQRRELEITREIAEIRGAIDVQKKDIAHLSNGKPATPATGGQA